MHRLIAVAVAVATAFLLAACTGDQPPAGSTSATDAGSGGTPVQEEPPIKVRNGSVEVLTPEPTRWAEETAGGERRWSQDRDLGGGHNQLHVYVHYANGDPPCTGGGKIIEIERANGNATFKRTGNRIKLTPKDAFVAEAANRIVTDHADGEILKIRAKENPNQINKECAGLTSVHDVICIRSSTIQACQ